MGPHWRLFHRDGQRISHASIYAKWKKLMRKKGLPWTIHDFRRSAVRNFVNSGVDSVVAKDMTGHKTLSMFSRYAINPREAMRRAAQRVDAYVTDPGEGSRLGIHRRPSRCRPADARGSQVVNLLSHEVCGSDPAESQSDPSVTADRRQGRRPGGWRPLSTSRARAHPTAGPRPRTRD